MKAIDGCVERGIIVSVGHTEAQLAQVIYPFGWIDQKFILRHVTKALHR